MSNKYELEQISPYRWRLSQDFKPGMRVPGEIIASEAMLPTVMSDKTPEQVANVATLPGIVGASMAMPDIHWGYGFPIGGVAAFDVNDGIISPGGVGYDVNCGVSLVRTNLTISDVLPCLNALLNELFKNIPCGVGSEGKIKLKGHDYDQILKNGVKWVVEQGLADPEDPEFMEENGTFNGADPSLISNHALERARSQLGTLGSGNHFIEIQSVSEIYSNKDAEVFGLEKDQIVIMVHSGSRGLGHQICDDDLKVMQEAARKYDIELPDRQLACAPFISPEGQRYFQKMKCAANFAWSNRLTMVGLIRETFAKVFNKSHRSLGMGLVYDVSHNIAKVEDFTINNERCELVVHRKGATRSLGKGDLRLPSKYRSVGQPVLIPGDMERASYVLAGNSQAEEMTFNSTCHGAGRVMSRNAAIKMNQGSNMYKKMAERGISVRAKGKLTLMEEIPEAYKNVSEVVSAVEGAGVSRRVARLKPVGTIKG